MHELLHLVGLCPDSLTHYDLTDFLMLHAKDFHISFKSYKASIWGLTKGI
jgi:hypothetical protein